MVLPLLKGFNEFRLYDSANPDATGSVVGAPFMAPVVAMHHIHDVDYVDDGRAEAGPYRTLRTI